MEIQLQELIEKIKKDGVKAAEEENASILAAANARAEQIVADAQAEADAILRRAQEESDRLVRVSEEAIRQAGRNLLLSFRESTAKELEAVAGRQVAAAYSPEVLAQLIPKVVEQWTANPHVEDLSVLLGKDDLAALEETLLAALKARMLEGVTLKPSAAFDGGFRIAVNGGSAYYDYSAAAVTEMMSAYLSPKVKTLMKEAEGL